MMSISDNEKSYSICGHAYKTKTAWSTFEKKADHFERIKIRWSECKICMKKNKLLPIERETYGTKLYYGQIVEVLDEEQQELALSLLGEMVKGKNNKRWSSLKRKLLTKYPYEILSPSNRMFT